MTNATSVHIVSILEDRIYNLKQLEKDAVSDENMSLAEVWKKKRQHAEAELARCQKHRAAKGK